MLSLHEGLRRAGSLLEKEAIQRQIAHTNHGIDQLVNELYGLSKEEIALVEEG